MDKLKEVLSIQAEHGISRSLQLLRFNFYKNWRQVPGLNQ